jgi:membrane protein
VPQPSLPRSPIATFSLHGRNLARILIRAVQEFSDDAMSIYAAALAYQALFALFPFLIFMVALVAYLDVPQLFGWMQSQAAMLVPAESMQQVNQVIAELRIPRSGLLSIGILLALWSASSGVMSAMEALNVAYDVPERRPLWQRAALAVIYTVGIAVLVLVAAGLMVLGPEAAEWVAARVGLRRIFVTVWTWARWPVAALLLMLVVSLVYYAGPNVRARFRFITPGAVLAVLIWIAASVGFGYYVQNFAQYDKTYGSLGAIVVLLFYFYLSAAVLLFGAEVNAVLQEGERGQRVSAEEAAAR